MKNLLKIILFLIIFFLMFFYAKDISESIISAIDIWKTNLIPALFPLMIISKFIINYNFSCKHLNNYFSKLFNINPNCFLIFIMSMISGFPSSAKYTKELLDNNIIEKNDAKKIILFSHFASPAFILITLSSTFLNNSKIGYLILFSHYFTNIILGLFIRNKDQFKEIKTYQVRTKPFSKVLSESILETMNTLLFILGTLVTYSIVITLFNKLPINIYYKSILTGFIELTEGLKSISLLNISLKLKASLATMLLSFGGLAIHTQIINILKIDYFKFLKFRILHAIISFIITLLLFNLFYRL